MSRFRNIRVPVKGGGHRIQRAMVLSSGKLKFVKGGARKRKHHAKKRHHRKGTKHVAKRRKRYHRRGGGRRRSSGGTRGWLPDRDTLYLAAGAGAYGWLEKKSKTDASFILNKLPKPIDALGFTGNVALITHVLNKFVKNRYLGYLSKGAIILTGYQLGRKGEAFKSGAEFFTVAGDGDDFLSGPEQYLDDATMGALAAEAEMSGVPFDDAVNEAIAHT